MLNLFRDTFDSLVVVGYITTPNGTFYLVKDVFGVNLPVYYSAHHLHCAIKRNNLTECTSFSRNFAKTMKHADIGYDIHQKDMFLGKDAMFMVMGKCFDDIDFPLYVEHPKQAKQIVKDTVTKFTRKGDSFVCFYKPTCDKVSTLIKISNRLKDFEE